MKTKSRRNPSAEILGLNLVVPMLAGQGLAVVPVPMLQLVLFVCFGIALVAGNLWMLRRHPGWKMMIWGLVVLNIFTSVMFNFLAFLPAAIFLLVLIPLGIVVI
jgi:hypothetical protein